MAKWLPKATERRPGHRLIPAINPIYRMAPQKYAIVVNGDNLDEAVEETAHLLYLLLGRALQAHRRIHSEECGFEEFALEALALLLKYRQAYTNPPMPPSPPHDA